MDSPQRPDTRQLSLCVLLAVMLLLMALACSLSAQQRLFPQTQNFPIGSTAGFVFNGVRQGPESYVALASLSRSNRLRCFQAIRANLAATVSSCDGTSDRWMEGR